MKFGKKKVIALIFFFFILYTFFWIYFFHRDLAQNSIITKPKSSVQNVLGVSDSNSTPTPTPIQKTDNGIPQNYFISLVPRKQIFNLSCEFASAATIIYHFTDNPQFSPQNELSAEENLINQIPASQNPNIGIRMGDNATESAKILYDNLNQKFGGANYYGVHAPPFIDLFPKYKLIARPIDKNSIVYSIKKAVYSGHLVMAWIRLGYGEPIDIALSYGSTKIVRGEHSVVIHGYDDNGVTVMDPALGLDRRIDYDTLLFASRFFPMPFLEVFPSSKSFSYIPTFGVDSLTELDRSKLEITVENGGRKIGEGYSMAGILKDFGYHVKSIQNADSKDYNDVYIFIKSDYSDYTKLLLRDLNLAEYKIASVSSAFVTTEPYDAKIIIGN